MIPDRPSIALTLVLALVPLVAACDREPTEPDPPVQDRDNVVPAGWLARYQSGSFTAGREHGAQRNGRTAAYIASAADVPSGYGNISQAVRAEDYRGERVRFAGWVRYEDVAGDGAGLWMRVDGPGEITAFDAMSGRRLTGTSDWREVSVVLDVAESALGFQVGVQLGGPGDLVVDDLRLDIVGDDVPTTNTLPSPVDMGVDSATVAASYERAWNAPVNLDFEGVPPLPDATVEFLRRTASPFARTEPGPSDEDLEPLRAMVGDARIVALGEATHGTREFFQLKHRAFQFLVREMGFTHFAIEATWPEANDVNRYVLTGEGDPAKLLSNLYFWIWNTQEVLDLIEWMREWNATAPQHRRVHFAGFDIQFPGTAIDSVVAFIERVDPPNAAFVVDRYSCLDDFRNHGPDRPPYSTRRAYAALPAATRDACRAGLQEVFDLIEAERVDYEAASSRARYENVLRSARLVQQFEHYIAQGGTAAANRARDAFMAENTIWLLDQAGPDARMMLWAHNGHVSRLPATQGDSLARAYGDSYVNLGFLFGRGSFNAHGVGDDGSDGPRPWHVEFVPEHSLEAVFLRTGEPRLLFDTREIPAGGPDAAPLHGPIAMRSITQAFDPARESTYFYPFVFPRHFDLLMFLEETTASTLLAFVY